MGLTAPPAYPSHSAMTSRIEPPPVSGCLPHIGALRFAGSDAAGFLQGQVSNDTRRLGAGEALLAAYSSPQGRVIALMHLIPHSSGILALLPRELIPVTLERLRRYILRSKVTIADVSADFVVLGRHIPDAPGTGAAGSGPPLPHATGRYEEAGGIGVARIGADSSRCWVLGSAGDFASPRRPIHKPSMTGALPTFAPAYPRCTQRPANCSWPKCSPGSDRRDQLQQRMFHRSGDHRAYTAFGTHQTPASPPSPAGRQLDRRHGGAAGRRPQRPVDGSCEYCRRSRGPGGAACGLVNARLGGHPNGTRRRCRDHHRCR